MRTLVIVCDHIGQMRAGLAVAQQVRELDCPVQVALDERGTAAGAYRQHQPRVVEALTGLRLPVFVHAARSNSCWDKLLHPGKSMLLSMLSPSLRRNAEMAALEVAHHRQVPTAGYAEMLGGQCWPYWSKSTQDHPPRLDWFDRLYVARRTTDLVTWMKPVVEVGLPLDAYRNFDRRARGRAAVACLKITGPFVWFYGSPNLETINTFQDLVTILSRYQAQKPLTLIVTRHARDRLVSEPAVRQKILVAYHSLMHAAAKTGMRVIEISHDHPNDELSSFAWPGRVEHRDLLCACHYEGVLVTMHGTDGLLAPYLGVPSILCCRSDRYDRVLPLEKGFREFPLTRDLPPQVGDQKELSNQLARFLLLESARADYLADCRQFCPFPKKVAAQMVAEDLIKLLQ